MEQIAQIILKDIQIIVKLEKKNVKKMKKYFKNYLYVLKYLNMKKMNKHKNIKI